MKYCGSIKLLLQESMTNWDDNMQIECAKSFIKPIQMNVRINYPKMTVQLVDKKNK